mgnify:CR=1 FL=1
MSVDPRGQSCNLHTQLPVQASQRNWQVAFFYTSTQIWVRKIGWKIGDRPRFSLIFPSMVNTKMDGKLPSTVKVPNRPRHVGAAYPQPKNSL